MTVTNPWELTTVGIRTAPVQIHNLSAGHMIRHDGQNKVVDGKSIGNIAGVWSVRIDFTDATQLVMPYPTAETSVDVITAFY